MHSLPFRRIAVTFLATVLLLGWDIVQRITSGTAYLSEHTIRLEVPTVLKHMRLNRDEADYYGKVAGTISDLSRRYPEKQIVNLTPDALFSAFDWGTRDFGKLPLAWPSFFEIIYPEFPAEVCSRISSERPLLISPPTMTRPEGYCHSTYISYPVGLPSQAEAGCSASAHQPFFSSGCTILERSLCPSDASEVRFDEPCPQSSAPQ